jgi:hypothetical protein
VGGSASIIGWIEAGVIKGAIKPDPISVIDAAPVRSSNLRRAEANSLPGSRSGLGCPRPWSSAVNATFRACSKGYLICEAVEVGRTRGYRITGQASYQPLLPGIFVPTRVRMSRMGWLTLKWPTSGQERKEGSFIEKVPRAWRSG